MRILSPVRLPFRHIGFVGRPHFFAALCYIVKLNETQSNRENSGTVPTTEPHSAEFIGVRDSRNRRVRRLYVRNGRFYVQLWVTRDDGGKTARRFPLLTEDGAPVTSLIEAKEAADVLRNDRREERLPTSGTKPKLANYTAIYFAKPTVVAKKPSTLASERLALNRWKAHLGDARIDRIEAGDIASFRDKRLRAGTNPRTVNLDTIALRADSGFPPLAPRFDGGGS